MVFLTIGKEIYQFNSNHLDNGYPKPLSHLGLPASLDKIDAALVWGHNNRTYFYSGTMYWRYVRNSSKLSVFDKRFFFCRYDEDIHHIELDYPRDMSIWQGIGYYINSAFQYTDGKNFVICIQYSRSQSFVIFFALLHRQIVLLQRK